MRASSSGSFTNRRADRMAVQSFTSTFSGLAWGWVSMPCMERVRKVYSRPSDPPAIPKCWKEWAMEWIIPTSSSKPSMRSKRARASTSARSVLGTPRATPRRG